MRILNLEKRICDKNWITRPKINKYMYIYHTKYMYIYHISIDIPPKARIGRSAELFLLIQCIFNVGDRVYIKNEEKMSESDNKPMVGRKNKVDRVQSGNQELFNIISYIT